MEKAFLIVLFFLSFSLQSQGTKICDCISLKKYEDSVQNAQRKMEAIIEEAMFKKNALTKPFKFVKVESVQNPALTYDIVDSLEYRYREAIFNKVPDSLFGFYEIKDSLRKEAFKQKYYGVPKPLVVKTGKLKNKIAVLYYTDSAFKSRYYLRISLDEGKTWKNYFTGLYKNDHYFFKSNSKFPLWRDDIHIQIESDILRMTKSLMFPGSFPEYEGVKNNSLVVLDLKEISKDSDGDGWNDLDEKMNYFTNPFSNDTDGDGIVDSEDMNPKYATISNDFTKIFESIMYGSFPILEDQDPLEESYEIHIDKIKEEIQKYQDELKAEYPKTNGGFVNILETNVVVTDDENLRRIDTYGERIIFLTSKEYREYQKINPFNLYTKSYTEIFKCDSLENTYVMKFDGVAFGSTFIIKKTPKGYKITILENWMT